MREIRLLAAEDVDAYVTVTVNAYPGFEMEAAATKERIRERTLASLKEENPRTHLWGVFEASTLLGIFRLHDFEMNFRGRLVPVGGLGGVAVGLAHKKQRVAYEIVQFFLEHYRRQGAFLTALYPFRTDFYKKMGFGYGAKLNEYRVPPAALPRDGARQQVRLLTAGDATAVHALYQHLLTQKPGMMAKEEKEITRLLSSDTMHGAGFFAGDRLLGYAFFKFRRADPENWLINDIVVRELLYADAAALRGLLAFLQTQADQIERIHFHSFDDDFHLLFDDVRDGSDTLIPSVYHQSNRQGVGLMYRVIDLPGLLAALPERKGMETVPGGVQLTLQDSFYPRNGGSWVVGWGDGRPRLLPETRADVALTLDIAEFSSWMMGVTDLATLLRLGLARLTEPSAALPLAQWFDFDRKPVCYTHF